MVCALASKYTTTLWGSFWGFILKVFTQMLEIVSTERGAYPILIGVWPYFKNHYGRGYVFIEQKFIRCPFFVMDQQNNAPAEICGNSMKTKLAFVSFKSTSSTMMI